MLKREIEVTLTYEALHFWANADSLPKVAFLKHPHRHLFEITLRKRVSENDRQIEFILFKREVLDYLARYEHDFGGQSCEMIAEELLTHFDCSLVKVMEDGENGAVLTKE